MTTIRTSSRSKTAAIHAANHARRSRSAFLPVVIAGVVLSTSATPRPGSADWPQFGRPVTTASKNQLHSAAATDGAGGAVITWQDDRFKRVNIFAGHVLASGDLDPAWPDDGQFESAERDRIIQTTPLGRVGTPEDIAQAVHFLACAPYVTGQIVAVDGGRSLFI